MGELQVYYLEQSYVGPWPICDFTGQVNMFGATWKKTPLFTQLADLFQGNVAAGYRQDVAGIGQSHHMTVVRERSGEHSYVILRDLETRGLAEMDGDDDEREGKLTAPGWRAAKGEEARTSILASRKPELDR